MSSSYHSAPLVWHFTVCVCVCRLCLFRCVHVSEYLSVCVFVPLQSPSSLSLVWHFSPAGRDGPLFTTATLKYLAGPAPPPPRPHCANYSRHALALALASVSGAGSSTPASPCLSCSPCLLLIDPHDVTGWLGEQPRGQLLWLMSLEEREDGGGRCSKRQTTRLILGRMWSRSMPNPSAA